MQEKHQEFYDLIAYIGFGWDSISNTIIASEVVWAEYIKVKFISTIYYLAFY